MRVLLCGCESLGWLLLSSLHSEVRAASSLCLLVVVLCLELILQLVQLAIVSIQEQCECECERKLNQVRVYYVAANVVVVAAST